MTNDLIILLHYALALLRRRRVFVEWTDEHGWRIIDGHTIGLGDL